MSGMIDDKTTVKSETFDDKTTVKAEMLDDETTVNMRAIRAPVVRIDTSENILRRTTVIRKELAFDVEEQALYDQMIMKMQKDDGLDVANHIRNRKPSDWTETYLDVEELLGGLGNLAVVSAERRRASQSIELRIRARKQFDRRLLVTTWMGFSKMAHLHEWAVIPTFRSLDLRQFLDTAGMSRRVNGEQKSLTNGELIKTAWFGGPVIRQAVHDTCEAVRNKPFGQHKVVLICVFPHTAVLIHQLLKLRGISTMLLGQKGPTEKVEYDLKMLEDDKGIDVMIGTIQSPTDLYHIRARGFYECCSTVIVVETPFHCYQIESHFNLIRELYGRQPQELIRYVVKGTCSEAHEKDVVSQLLE